MSFGVFICLADSANAQQESYTSKMLGWTIKMPSDWTMSILDTPQYLKELSIFTNDKPSIEPSANADTWKSEAPPPPPPINSEGKAGSSSTSTPPEIENTPPAMQLYDNVIYDKEHIIFKKGLSMINSMVQPLLLHSINKPEEDIKTIIGMIIQKMELGGLSVQYKESMEITNKKRFYKYTLSITTVDKGVANGYIYAWNKGPILWVTTISYIDNNDRDILLNAFKEAAGSF